MAHLTGTALECKSNGQQPPSTPTPRPPQYPKVHAATVGIVPHATASAVARPAMSGRASPEAPLQGQMAELSQRIQGLTGQINARSPDALRPPLDPRGDLSRVLQDLLDALKADLKAQTPLDQTAPIVERYKKSIDKRDPLSCIKVLCLLIVELADVSLAARSVKKVSVLIPETRKLLLQVAFLLQDITEEPNLEEHIRQKIIYVHGTTYSSYEEIAHEELTRLKAYFQEKFAAAQDVEFFQHMTNAVESLLQPVAISAEVNQHIQSAIRIFPQFPPEKEVQRMDDYDERNFLKWTLYALGNVFSVIKDIHQQTVNSQAGPLTVYESHSRTMAEGLQDKIKHPHPITSLKAGFAALIECIVENTQQRQAIAEKTIINIAATFFALDRPFAQQIRTLLDLPVEQVHINTEFHQAVENTHKASQSSQTLADHLQVDGSHHPFFLQMAQILKAKNSQDGEALLLDALRKTQFPKKEQEERLDPKLLKEAITSLALAIGSQKALLLIPHLESVQKQRQEKLDLCIRDSGIQQDQGLDPVKKLFNIAQALMAQVPSPTDKLQTVKREIQRIVAIMSLKYDVFLKIRNTMYDPNLIQLCEELSKVMVHGREVADEIDKFLKPEPKPPTDIVAEEEARIMGATKYYLLGDVIVFDFSNDAIKITRAGYIFSASLFGQDIRDSRTGRDISFKDSTRFILRPNPDGDYSILEVSYSYGTMKTCDVTVDVKECTASYDPRGKTQAVIPILYQPIA